MEKNKVFAYRVPTLVKTDPNSSVKVGNFLYITKKLRFIKPSSNFYKIIGFNEKNFKKILSKIFFTT